MTASKLTETKRIVGVRTTKDFIDFYPTCPEAVISLLANETFEDGVVWECAVGDGAIAKVLEKCGEFVVSSDLYDYGYPFCYDSNLDFLKDVSKPNYIEIAARTKHIITNPPFSLANKFAERGIELITKSGGKLALLCRLQYLESIWRGENIFRNTPSFDRVLVASRRLPRMHKGDYNGKKSTSMIAYAWFIWDGARKDTTLKPTITWFDWKDYVS